MSELLPSGETVPVNALSAPSTWPRVLTSADAPRQGGAGDLGDLKEILGIVRRRRWLVLSFASLGAGIAAYFAYSAKPVFLASASVRIADARNALSGGIADAPRDNIGSSYSVDPVLSQIQVLKSREVAAEAVRRQPLGLIVYPEGFPASDVDQVKVDSLQLRSTAITVDFDADSYTLHESGHDLTARYGQPLSVAGVTLAIVRRPARRSAIIGVLSKYNAIGMLLDGVDARPRKSTDVVDVTYRANDPFVAQQVVNSIVDSYKEVNADIAQQQSRRRREFIQEQLKQTDSLFADATGALSNYRTQVQVYGSDARVAAEQTGLMTLDVTREQLAADKNTLQSLLDNLQNGSKDTHSERLDALMASPGVAENTVVTALFGQYIQLRTKRDSLTTGGWSSAKSNPDVMKLDTLIATTQAGLLSAVRSNVQAVDARLASLDALRTRNSAQMQKLPGVQAVEARLLQRVETARKMADQLREEYQRARISEAVEVGQVELVDLAVQPDTPIGRGALFRIFTGLIIGLMLGGGAAVLAERLNTTVRRRDDVELMLHVPGLAVIPQISTPRKLGSLGRALKLPGMTVRRDKYSSDALVTISDFGSVGAEAYRTLRTNLIFSQAIQTLRTIVVTSPSPKDGKTTTAANLAVTFAQQGMRVLIIDCDMRKARLHYLFQLPREPGFSQLLAKQATIEQVVQQTSVENLSLIAAGLLPANPSELLGSAIARSTIESLSTKYDIVILDTPPVHVAADALILGSMANGVLLVLRAGYSEREAAQQALQRLLNVGAHVVGAVLNDPDHKVPEYGAYYYYYDYHDEKVEA
jgi:capsular exopolysaccharide synthesis family protein